MRDSFHFGANFSDLDANVGEPALFPPDSTTTTIGWTSGKAIPEGIGFIGPATANLGNVFPTGLDLTGLQNLLQDALRTSSLGGGELAFDLVVVPEPNAFLFLIVSSTGMVLSWSCRRLWRSLFRA